MKIRHVSLQRWGTQLWLVFVSLFLSLLHLNACQQNAPHGDQSTPNSLGAEETLQKRDASSASMLEIAVSDSDLRDGEKVWTDNCFSCHGTGRAGAPKIGEKSQWAPRIAQGIDILIGHALTGFYGKGGTEMPAKGGNPALSDEDIRIAVAYMITQSQ